MVPAGIEADEMIRLTGQGEASPKGTPGDLYVKVHIEKHPVFRRDGVNLIMDLPIKLTDSLLGATYEIETLDGKSNLKIPEGITSGEILKIKDRGVPMRGNKRGDLAVRVTIKTPTKLSKKARLAAETLKEEGV